MTILFIIPALMIICVILGTSKLILTPCALVFLILFLTTSGIFFYQPEFIVLLYVFFLYVFIIIALLVERFITRKYYTKLNHKFINLKHVSLYYYLLWLFSLPSVVVMFSLIYSAGGVVEYMISLASRVDQWKGKGFIIMILKSYPVFNLLYFCVLFLHQRRSFFNKFFYLIHFFGFVCIALATGSRNTLLLNIFLMLLFCIIVGRPLSKKIVLTVGCIGLMLLLALGVLRNSWFSNHTPVGQSDISFIEKNKTLLYSIDPLETVLSSTRIESGEIYHGATYLSLITNFVPRSLWSDKFKTGGVLLTEDYYDDRWGGFSYISPGFFVEGIINFGYVGGALFAFLFLVINFIFLIFFYKKILSFKSLSLNNIFLIVIYMYFVFSVSNVFFAEFTTNYFNLILRLIPLFSFWFSFHFVSKLVIKKKVYE